MKSPDIKRVAGMYCFAWLAMTARFEFFWRRTTDNALAPRVFFARAGETAKLAFAGRIA